MTTTADSIKTLSLRDAGMFSNVNEVLDNILKAKNEGYKFYVDWSDSPYRDTSMDVENPWEYYFSQPFDVDFTEAGEQLPMIAKTEDEVVAPHVRVDYPVSSPHGLFLPPKNRERISKIIKDHLYLKEHINRKIDSFVANEFSNPTIGVHLRGPHQVESGHYRDRYSTDNNVPFSLIFEYLDKRLDEMPSASIFVASDAKLVINKFKNRYDNVISYEADRLETGEMHNASIFDRRSLKITARHILDRKVTEGLVRMIDLIRSRNLSSYHLGEDVLVDAHLLSKTDHLIHGSSNVSNFVLCKRPSLQSDFIFKSELQKIHPKIHEWEVGDDLQINMEEHMY